MSIQSSPKKIGVLVSGSGSNLQAIIDQVENGDINGEISCIISNQKDVYALERARNHQIASTVIRHQQFPKRELFDTELLQTLEQAQVELVVLAGFMRVLGDQFVEAYYGRLLNIHPSLLPDFPGLHTHQRVLQAGHKTHGCSVHFVVPELDAGPIILQASVPVYTEDTPDSVASRVLEKEHIIYPLCIKWYCEGTLALQNGSVVVAGNRISAPLQLDQLNL